MLKKKLSSLIKQLPRACVLTPARSKSDLIGSIRGRLTYFLILENDRKLNHSEIMFSEKIRRCNGDFFVIRSLEDFCEIAKIRGWHDD